MAFCAHTYIASGYKSLDHGVESAEFFEEFFRRDGGLDVPAEIAVKVVAEFLVVNGQTGERPVFKRRLADGAAADFEVFPAVALAEIERVAQS